MFFLGSPIIPWNCDRDTPCAKITHDCENDDPYVLRLSRVDGAHPTDHNSKMSGQLEVAVQVCDAPFRLLLRLSARHRFFADSERRQNVGQKATCTFTRTTERGSSRCTDTSSIPTLRLGLLDDNPSVDEHGPGQLSAEHFPARSALQTSLPPTGRETRARRISWKVRDLHRPSAAAVAVAWLP